MRAVIGLLRATYEAWNADRAERLAAALAFYATFALAPFLIVVIQIAGLVLGNTVGAQHARAELLNIVARSAGHTASQGMNVMLNDIMANQGSSVLAAIIGWAVVVIAAGGLFGAVEDALNTVWEVPKERGGWRALVRDRFVPYAMIGGIALLLIITLVVNALITSLALGLERVFPGFVVVFQILGVLVSFFITMALIAGAYKWLPGVSVHWRDVVVGAFVTALLFTIGEIVLGLYLGRPAMTSWYGAAGSLVVILLWVYYCAQIFLAGAEFTKVFSRRYGSKRRVTQADAA